MQRVYKLDALDCPNCAMKVERKVSKVQGVEDVTVDFVQKKMYVEIHDESIIENIRTCIKQVEPDVNMLDVTPVKKEEHSTCGCNHDHHEHEEHTSCEHEHEHQGECCEQHHECGCHEAHELEERSIQGAIKFRVQGLDCASCAQKVETAVAKQDNIKDVSLSFSTGILFVETDHKEDVVELHQRIQNTIDGVESGVTLLMEHEKVETDKAAKSSQRKEIIRLFVGIFIFLVAVYFENQSFAIYLFLSAYVITGGKVVYTAFRNILRGEIFDENFLMSIATIGAFFIGSYEEALEVMIFYEIGELFQSYAVNRSRKSISALMDIRADYANKLVDGQEVRVTPEEVKIDDILQVRPGERVALDGILIKGETSLDTSALTGESLPRDVQEQDEILAGSVNLSGLIQLRVTKVYQESTVARILELVENAGNKKAPMEKFITKFARIYTPVVVFLALALVILPMMFLKDAVFYDWLYRALTFLVVSCPCALVVSIPLGLFAGIGGASKKGILIKGGNYLEALSSIDRVVFDKTGTLTKGSFHVDHIYPIDGIEDALLELGAYGEAFSNHPIAQSIVAAYGKSIDRTRIQNFEEIAGNGIRVLIDGVDTLLGNMKLMEAHHISYEKNTPVGTIIHIAQESVYKGYIVINDEIKPTSAQAIQDLKAEGVKQCIMLTGDRNEVAQFVGEKLQLDKVYAQLLPADKVQRVEELLAQETGGKLAFVGDGINDAPVLARSDIGVAMGGIGSDAAIEAADVVLMKDDLSALAEAIRISKKTKRILWQNIVFSLGVKIIVLILTVFGLSTMRMGVFADVGVTLLAVLNSMRALKTT